MTENGPAAIVGVDGSASSKDALRWAFDYAVAVGAPLGSVSLQSVQHAQCPVVVVRGEVPNPS